MKTESRFLQKSTTPPFWPGMPYRLATRAYTLPSPTTTGWKPSTLPRTWFAGPRASPGSLQGWTWMTWMTWW